MNLEYRMDGKFRMPCKLRDGTMQDNFILHLFSFPTNNPFLAPEEHFHVITLGNIERKKDLLMRIESACTYAHLYGSQLCDCQYQRDESLLRISQENRGMYIYCLDQNGRGTGIVNHIKAYQTEQDLGLDTVEAHKHLGFPDDARDYAPIIKILNHFSISSVRLMTNNPKRLKALQEAGIQVKRVPLQGPLHKYNIGELKTKQQKLGHLYDYDFSSQVPILEKDEEWMKFAIELAKSKGLVQDKPLVGAVVTNNGKFVSDGYGVQGTHMHAEVMAIMNAGKKAKNGTLYTTLEPCIDAYTFPSCCRKAIESGISEVVFGSIDPHPIVDGRGIRTLENAGIKTRSVLTEETDKLISEWIKKWRS